MLGADKFPTINMRDILMSGLLAKCTATRDVSQAGSVAHDISSILGEDVWARMFKVTSKSPMIGIVCQVATF